MEEEYERGYQDGQTDTEEELMEEILRYNRNIELQHTMGHSIMNVTLQLTNGDRLFNILYDHFIAKNQRNQLSTPLENFKKRTCDPLATTNSEEKEANEPQNSATA